MPIKVTKDGRTIRTGIDYTVFRRAMWQVEDGRCQNCGRLCDLNAEPQDYFSFHVHHLNGRGMGGSKRNDTPEACKGLCGGCHRKEHGQ